MDNTEPVIKNPALRFWVKFKIYGWIIGLIIFIFIAIIAISLFIYDTTRETKTSAPIGTNDLLIPNSNNMNNIGNMGNIGNNPNQQSYSYSISSSYSKK